LENILDRFHSLNPDITVSFSDVRAEYGTTVETAIVSGQQVNVMLVREGQAGLWWSKQLLQPLSGISSFDTVADALFPAARHGVETEGKLIGLPFYTDAIFLAYNKSMLDKIGAGPPETWEELLAYSRTLQNRGLSRWPLSLNFSPKANANLPWWAMVYGAGGKLREPGDELRDAEPQDIVPSLLRMLRTFLVDDLILNPDFGETSYSAILEGDTAFSLVGSYLGRIAANQLTHHSSPLIRFATVPGLDTPAVATVGWTPFYSVPTTASNLDLSALLALHLGAIDGTGDFFAPRVWALQEGLPPAYPSVLHEAAVRSQFQTWIDLDLLEDTFASAKPVEALWEPWFSTWEHWMQDELQAALWGSKTELAAANSINRYAHGLSRRLDLDA
jgi:multiple sugar transport system substrate-binding protein